MSTVFERVKKVVVEQLSVDEALVTENASFTADLGADSLEKNLVLKYRMKKLKKLLPLKML